ncbi:polyhydroxyalkanoate depolymerase [bacterium]|nr:polyhydroxyalkanoate depolymerase [bacterium]
MERILSVLFIAIFVMFQGNLSFADNLASLIPDALRRAGTNRSEIEDALSRAPSGQRAGMEFLIAHMPDQDLQSLKTDFLLDNLDLAYKAWSEAPWREQVSEELFFNNVLPYANVNEQRDSWREDFYTKCKPIIVGAKTPSEAAVLLNQKLFKQLNVRYSTKRNRADQGPAESIRTGLASCTGLSVLLIDACRAVGIPARFVGTPLWANKSGNHSWVEIWDDGWHFTGACEPTGGELDKGWFKGRAATALADHPLHAIYAVSYKKTPSPFPLVWAPSNRSVSAVNVTERYTKNKEPLAVGHVEVLVKVVDGNGERLSVPIQVFDESQKSVFSGKTKDERFDANDHCAISLREGKEYTLHLTYGNGILKRSVVARKQNEPHTLVLADDGEETTKGRITEGNDSESDASGASAQSTSEEVPATESPLLALKKYLAQPEDQRPILQEQAFSQQGLTETLSQRAEALLWSDHVKMIRRERQREMEEGKVAVGELSMPFFYRTFGQKPKDGRSLYISMHGGGGAPAQVNDQQWENQKRLYTVPEGVYLAPRAPTNTWNLWHQPHIDGLFARLIENLIVFEDVNPDKVYLMGYSAGGDGVYQVAPRMADRFAAAAMMAGHPNETSPLGLRNLAFTIHMGGKDSAYKRNQIAADWKSKLAGLRQEDPSGYEHLVTIYPNKGHWMDRQDASAIPWMAKYRRTRHPDRVVWKQDDVQHQRFYWLAVNPKDIQGRPLVIVSRNGQEINIEQSDVEQLTIRLSDEMLELDQPIQLRWGDSQLPEITPIRTIATLAKTLAERGDRGGMFSAEFQLTAPKE